MKKTLFLILLLLLVTNVFTPPPAFSQGDKQFKVSGMVSDTSKDPLVGATIKELGTKNGTVTNLDGLFELTVSSPTAQLEVSYISYETIQIKVANQPRLRIVLRDASVALSDVVVVGYGKASSKDIASSITSLTEKDLNKGPVSSIAQMIQGKVAGVYISKDGDPNSAGSLIIRGTSTLRTGAQSPLYVIDGVPTTRNVTPEDIISIDILKDASATAIYGSRAANGVIMITTRQGKGGEQKYTTANAYISIEQVSNRYEMMNGDQYRTYLTDNGSGVEPGWDDKVNMDWQKEIMRTAIMHNYYFNTGGTSNNTKYDASVNFVSQQGIIKTTGQQKMSMRANVEQAFLNDRLSIGATVSSTVTDQDKLPSASTVYRSMLTFVPTTLPTNANGTYKEDIDRRDPNPIALINQNQRQDKNKTMFGSLHAKWDIVTDLTFNTTLSYQNDQYNTGVYLDKNSKLALGKNGEAIRGAYENTETIFENYLTYEKKMQDHKFGAMLGYSWQENNTDDGFQATNINFMSDATSYYNLGLGSSPAGYNVNYGDKTIKTLRMISFFGRLNYNYKQRYILQASLRRDGSSAFGKNNRWGLFPSISGAWRIISEDFMADQKIFSDLKLKTGYGISGNSMGFDPMVSTLRYGSVGKSYYKGAYINSIGVVQNENPDLKWEKTAMINIGLDAAFFNSRVRVGVEWYNKMTSDLIWEYNVPLTKYLHNKMVANVGKISNRGIELTLGADVITGKDFSWTTGVTMAHNKNKVESLSNDLFKVDYVYTVSSVGAGQSGGSAQIIKEGYPIGTFYTLKFQGFSKDGKSQFLNKAGEITTSPVAPDDYYACGDAQPKLNYSWTNNLTWNRFNLDLLFRGVLGQDVLNATLAKLVYSSRVSHYNQPKYVLESGQPFNDIRSHFISDRYIEKADFFRLENVNLGYTLPIKNKYIRDVNLYLNVSNAFVFTSYKGIDPEVSMGGIEPGVDNNNLYPKTRSFQMGVKLNF